MIADLQWGTGATYNPATQGAPVTGSSQDWAKYRAWQAKQQRQGASIRRGVQRRWDRSEELRKLARRRHNKGVLAREQTDAKQQTKTAGKAARVALALVFLIIALVATSTALKG